MLESFSAPVFERNHMENTEISYEKATLKKMKQAEKMNCTNPGCSYSVEIKRMHICPMCGWVVRHGDTRHNE